MASDRGYIIIRKTACGALHEMERRPDLRDIVVPLYPAVKCRCPDPGHYLKTGNDLRMFRWEGAIEDHRVGPVHIFEEVRDE